MTATVEKGDRQRLLTRLAELDDNRERARFLADNPALASAATVVELGAEVARLGLVDLDRAARLAAAGRDIAEDLKDPGALAHALRAEANVLHQRGEYRAAGPRYDEALELFVQLGDEEQAAVTRSHGISNLSYLGEHEQADRWANEAERHFTAAGSRDRIARLKLNRGLLLARRDRFHEALALFQAAHREFLALDDQKSAALALRNLAVCHQDLDQFGEALAAYQQARELCRQHDLPRLLHAVDYNIAFLYYLRGDYPRALERLQAARESSEALDDHRHQALCDLDQGEIYLELNLVTEAEALARRAAIAFTALGMRPESARARVDEAIAHFRQGRAFAALDALALARDAFIAEGSRIWPWLIDLYRALIFYHEGRAFESSRLARRAAEGFATQGAETKLALAETLLAQLALDGEDPAAADRLSRSACERLQALSAPALGYQAQLVRGRVAEARGDVDAAFAAYRVAHHDLERLRSHLRAEELRIALIEDKLTVYKSLVWLHLHGESGARDPSAAFCYAEKAKAQSLADQLAARAHTLPPKVATRSNLAEEIRNLREELNWYSRQIDRQEMSDKATPGRLAELRRTSRAQETRLLSSLRELGRTDREFSSLQQATTVELGTIQRSLPANMALVEYYVARDVVYGFVVGRDRLHVETLTVASRVADLHRRLIFQLSRSPAASGPMAQQESDGMRSSLTALYDELFAPLQEHCPEADLAIVPHRSLHRLPFQALFDGERYLADRYRITQAPSATIFSLCQDPPSAGEGVLLAAGDDPGCLGEVQALAPSLPGARILTGDQLSADALAGGGRRRLIHLAASGEPRYDNPMFSTVRLGELRLSLFDLYGLDLSADLVTLTGCGRGLDAGDGTGDEVAGLARGLLYAGARSALITLWETDPASRELFLATFYGADAPGAPLEALQTAASEVRQRYPNPFHWAPYVLIGRG